VDTKGAPGRVGGAHPIDQVADLVARPGTSGNRVIACAGHFVTGHRHAASRYGSPYLHDFKELCSGIIHLVFCRGATAALSSKSLRGAQPDSKTMIGNSRGEICLERKLQGAYDL
jgi:hypothetical protein